MTNIPFKINYNGEWFYHETLINRKSIIKLFSTILELDEDGSYHLRTPVEDCLVQVEDVPFIITSFKLINNKKGLKCFCFETNLDQKIELGPTHPLWMKKLKKSKELIPYVLFEKGISARVSRSVYYDLADFIEIKKQKNKMIKGIISNNVFFPLDRETFY